MTGCEYPSMNDYIKKIIPFLPLLIVSLILILKPYYLMPTMGDTDYHLVRALEILKNPTLGIYWDYLIYPPIGRSIWHPPLFHSIYALLWYMGGIRFAHSLLCFFQIFFTVFVASWVAKEEYGNLACFFAGILSLAGPRISMYTIPMPVAYIPILAMLTIHFMPKEKYKAFITSLVGVWTHMFGSIIFIALFVADGLKNRTNLKMIILLLPSIILWAVYWILFKDQAGSSSQIATQSFWMGNNPTGFLILLFFGITGIYYLYHSDQERFRLYITYFTVISISSVILFGDFSRLLQALSLPLAILSSLTIKRIYEYIDKKYKRSFSLTTVASLLIITITLIGVTPFFSALNSDETTWNDINIPFDYEYNSLNNYITKTTSENETLWADKEIAERIAWMTGRSVSNSNFGRANNRTNLYQRINIYVLDNTFLIRDYNNNTLKEILKNN